MDPELQIALDGLSTETKKIFADLAAKNTSLEEAQSKMQAQVDAIDLNGRPAAHGPLLDGDGKTLGEEVAASPEFVRFREAGWRGIFHFRAKGFFPARKALISNVGLGSGTSGILMPARVGGVNELARQGLRLRDVMATQQLTSGNSFDWLKQTTRTNAASPQTEGSAKAESTYAWVTVSSTVKTIAHFVNVTKQALDDVTWLQRSINSELLYGLALAEEYEILAGSGTGDHLLGLIPQATAYNTAFDVAGDTDLDKLRHAKLQARQAGQASYAPSAVALNPKDIHDLELIKSDEGATANKGLYVIGDPSTGAVVRFVWGLPVVESDSIQPGKFLIGAFDSGALIIDRQEATIDISFEHGSNFVENKATIRAEERIGLAVMRPDAFIYGSI